MSCSGSDALSFIAWRKVGSSDNNSFRRLSSSDCARVEETLVDALLPARTHKLRCQGQSTYRHPQSSVQETGDIWCALRRNLWQHIQYICVNMQAYICQGLRYQFRADRRYTFGGKLAHNSDRSTGGYSPLTKNVIRPSKSQIHTSAAPA
jgi:hypothetical protein